LPLFQAVSGLALHSITAYPLGEEFAVGVRVKKAARIRVETDCAAILSTIANHYSDEETVVAYNVGIAHAMGGCVEKVGQHRRNA
jgi:hypothetical protein